MFAKLSIVLLLAASPALAEEAAQPAEPATAAETLQPVAYKTKKVCRSIEVVGSSIPKTTCTTKKIPIKPVEEDVADGAEAPAQPSGQL